MLPGPSPRKDHERAWLEIWLSETKFKPDQFSGPHQDCKQNEGADTGSACAPTHLHLGGLESQVKNWLISGDFWPSNDVAADLKAQSHHSGDGCRHFLGDFAILSQH